MENLKVIYFEAELPSFSWTNGLYAIQKEIEGTLYLWKIDKGVLSTYEDGKPNVMCTGVNNKGIKPTNLTITQ